MFCNVEILIKTWVIDGFYHNHTILVLKTAIFKFLYLTTALFL